MKKIIFGFIIVVSMVWAVNAQENLVKNFSYLQRDVEQTIPSKTTFNRLLTDFIEEKHELFEGNKVMIFLMAYQDNNQLAAFMPYLASDDGLGMTWLADLDGSNIRYFPRVDRTAGINNKPLLMVAQYYLTELVGETAKVSATPANNVFTVLGKKYVLSRDQSDASQRSLPKIKS